MSRKGKIILITILALLVVATVLYFVLSSGGNKDKETPKDKGGDTTDPNVDSTNQAVSSKVQSIAKEIYDAKGYVDDDEKEALEAFKRIDNKFEFEQLDSFFKATYKKPVLVYMESFMKNDWTAFRDYYTKDVLPHYNSLK